MNILTRKRYILMAAIVGVVGLGVFSGYAAGLFRFGVTTPVGINPSGYVDTAWINLYDGFRSGGTYLAGCESRSCAGMGQTSKPLYQFDGNNYNFDSLPGPSCSQFDNNSSILSNPPVPYQGAFCDSNMNTRVGTRLVGSTQGDGFSGSRGLPIVIDGSALNLPKGQYNVELIASLDSTEALQAEPITVLSYDGLLKDDSHEPQNIHDQVTLRDYASGECARDHDTPTFEWFATDCSSDAWKNPATEATVGQRMTISFEAGDSLMIYGALGSVQVGGIRLWGTPDNNAPTCSSLTIRDPKSEYEVGETVTFDTQASDPDGGDLRYVYRFGDGKEEEGGTTITHSYGSGGLYEVTVTVIDDKGWQSEAPAENDPCAVSVSVKEIPAEASFAKTVDKIEACPDETLTYSLSFTMTGGDDLGVIQDFMPDEVTYVPGSMHFAGTVNGQVIDQDYTDLHGDDAGTYYYYPYETPGRRQRIWVSWEPIEDGSNGTLTFEVKVNNVAAGTEIVNTGTFDTFLADPIEKQASTTVKDCAPAAPTIGITKEVDKAMAHAGDELTYTLIYSVSGDTPAGNVVITDSIPDYATYQRGQTAQVGLSELTPLTDDSDSDLFDYDISQADTLTFLLGNVNPGSSGRFQFKVLVNADTPAGTTIDNIATIDADLVDPVSAQANTEIISGPLPSLFLEKGVDKPTANPGDQLTYVINYRNDGEGDAHDVVLYDYYPENYLTFNTASDGGYDYGGQIIWELGTLPAGASGSVTWTGTLTSSFPSGNTEVENIAVIDCDETEPLSVAVNTTVSVQTTGPYVNAYKSVVDDNGGDIEPGDTITYVIYLINEGDQVAENVSFADDLPANVGNLQIVSLPAGAQNTSQNSGGQNNTGQVIVGGMTLVPGEEAMIVYTVTINADVPDGTAINNVGSVAVNESEIPSKPRQGVVVGAAAPPPSPQILGAATAPSAPATGIDPVWILSIIVFSGAVVSFVLYRRRLSLSFKRLQ